VIYTTLKLTSCLMMLLIVLTGCPMEEQTPRNGAPTTTPPATDPDQPQEPITTETPQHNAYQDNLQQQLQREIQEDPQLSGQNIQIQERNGRVTLSGSVQSAQQSQRIMQLAEQIAGPGNIDNQLRVEQDQQDQQQQPQ